VSAGRQYSDWQLRTHHFSKAAAAAWAQVNLNAKKWATENGWGVRGQYSITRCVAEGDPTTVSFADESNSNQRSFCCAYASHYTVGCLGEPSAAASGGLCVYVSAMGIQLLDMQHSTQLEELHRLRISNYVCCKSKA
jgi:hypothetical protein